MRRRRQGASTSLTSLLDVLFILVFASLIQAASLVEGAEEKLDSARNRAESSQQQNAPPREIDVDQKLLHDIAISTLQTRATLFVRISGEGEVISVEAGPGFAGPSVPNVGEPLLEGTESGGLRYLGDGIREARLCSIARRATNLDTIEGFLVVFAPQSPLDDLSVALARGLRADQQRCFSDEQAVGVLVDPGALALQSPALP